MRIEVCSECHPFFTGEQRIVDTAGRVERFRRRFGLQEEEGGVVPPPPAEDESAEAEGDESEEAAEAPEAEEANP